MICIYMSSIFGVRVGSSQIPNDRCGVALFTDLNCFQVSSGRRRLFWLWFDDSLASSVIFIIILAFSDTI